MKRAAVAAVYLKNLVATPRLSRAEKEAVKFALALVEDHVRIEQMFWKEGEEG